MAIKKGKNKAHKALGRGIEALIPRKPHCGHPGRSRRLAKTLNCIMDFGTCTTFQIQRVTGSMKPSTDVDDLRRAGYRVSMATYVRTTSDGRRVFRYTWLG